MESESLRARLESRNNPASSRHRFVAATEGPGSSFPSTAAYWLDRSHRTGREVRSSRSSPRSTANSVVACLELSPGGRQTLRACLAPALRAQKVTLAEAEESSRKAHSTGSLVLPNTWP